MRIDAVDAEWARPGVSERTRIYFEISNYHGIASPECSILDPGMLDNQETKYAVPVPDAYFRLMGEAADPPTYLGWVPDFPQEIVANTVRSLQC